MERHPHLTSTSRQGTDFSRAGDAQLFTNIQNHVISRHGGICNVPSTCMLTTSSIPKAVQVCSSKAFAAVQAMTAMTRKIASERIVIGTNLVVKTLELNLSLKQAKK